MKVLSDKQFTIFKIISLSLILILFGCAALGMAIYELSPVPFIGGMLLVAVISSVIAYDQIKALDQDIKQMEKEKQ